MAVSVSTVKSPFVPKFISVTDVTCSSSYTSGGEPLTAEQLGIGAGMVEFAMCNLKVDSESEEYVSSAFYDPAAQLLHLIDAKTGKEVVSTKNMEKVVVRVLTFGRSRAR